MSIENNQKTNISCDICLDLIPLVRDSIASDDSKALVYEHIKGCDNCKSVFGSKNCNFDNKIDDKKIIRLIRKRLTFFATLFIILGALLGVYFSYSFDMLYNIWIMPIVGSLGYLVLNKKWYLTSVGIFVLSYIWLFIQNYFDVTSTTGLNAEAFGAPLLISVIYTILSILGVLIAALLKFALKKEDTK